MPRLPIMLQLTVRSKHWLALSSTAQHLSSSSLTVHHLWVCVLSRSGFNNFCEGRNSFLRTPLVKNWRMLARQLGAGAVYWPSAWSGTALKEIIPLENRIIRPTWKKHENRIVRKNAFDRVIDLITRFWNTRKFFVVVVFVFLITQN